MTANFKPTQIIFTDEYEGHKLRRLAQQVTDLGNRMASVGNAATAASFPTGGAPGDVLTQNSTLTPVWAPPQTPTSFPWSQITGIPSSFPAAPFHLADTSSLGPLPQISGASPGMVLEATGTTTAKFAFLNYSQLGDVDTTGIADGYVPAWSNTTGKWEMVPNGAGFSGLTPGYVYTAVSPTAAQFLQMVFTEIGGVAAPAQLGFGTASYGAGDPRLPLKTPAGNATLFAEMNQNTAFDTVLTGDGRWTSIRDIEISWSQISDIPSTQVTPYTGNRKQYLAGDQTWQTIPAPLVIQQVFSMPGDDGPQADDGIPMPGIQGVPGATGATGSPGVGSPIPGDDGAAGDDGMPMPGIQGVPGATGATGSPGVGAPIPGDDGAPGDDGIPMPGIQGAQGIQGAIGAQGSPSIHFWADDGNQGDDGIPIIGPPGPAGANGTGGGGAAMMIPGDDGRDGDDGMMIMPIAGPIINSMQNLAAEIYIATFGGGAF